MHLSLVIVAALSVVAVCVASSINTKEPRDTEVDKRVTPGCYGNYCQLRNRYFGRYNSGRYNFGRYNSGRYNFGRYNSGRYNFGRYNLRHTPRPAFVAFASENLDPDDTNLFNDQRLDTRHSYFPLNSTFLAEDSGLYVFNLIMKATGNNKVPATLSVDGNIVLTVQGSGSSTGAGQIILYLREGEWVQAKLEKPADRNGSIALGSKCSFSGYQLDQYMDFEHHSAFSPFSRYFRRP